MEDLKNTCKVSENAEKQLRTYDVRCRCSSIKRTSKKRVKELNSLKKYARDQFTVGLIESQIKYWLELQ